MITRLEIENFRGIAHGTLDGLAPLTVLVGPNNSGKSSVLESLALAMAGARGDAIRDVVRRRGDIGAQAVSALVRRPATSARVLADDRITELHLSSRTDGGRELNLKSPDGEARYGAADKGGAGWTGSTGEARTSIIEVDRGIDDPSEFERVASWADLAGTRKWLIEVLRPLLPGLIDLRIQLLGQRATLYIEDEQGQWPAISAGDGFKRLLIMAARIASQSSPLSLIEEPEAHLHPRGMAQVARLFWEMTKPQRPGEPEGAPVARQLVVTTQSLEYLDAQFLEASSEELARAAVFRLALAKGELRAVRVPGEHVKQLRLELGEDLRR